MPLHLQVNTQTPLQVSTHKAKQSQARQLLGPRAPTAPRGPHNWLAWLCLAHLLKIAENGSVLTCGVPYLPKPAEVISGCTREVFVVEPSIMVLADQPVSKHGFLVLQL